MKTIIDENKLPETDCVKLYNKEVILKFIKKLEYNFDKIVKLEHYVWEDKEILLECLLLRNFEDEDINIVDDIIKNQIGVIPSRATIMRARNLNKPAR